MSNHPSSFAEWQDYPSTLDPIHVAWLKSAKKSKTAFAVADIEGVEISHKKFLTGVLLFSKKIEVYSPEQNVGLLLPSSGGGAIASIAILSLGKTLVNLNFTAGKKALNSAAKQAEVKHIYTSRKFLDKMLERGMNLESYFPESKLLMLEDIKEEISTLSRLGTLLKAILFPASFIQKSYFKKVSMNDTAAILFSSGSEGSPKGVELSHANIAANAKQAAIELGAVDSDVIMSTLPTFHAFGFAITTLMPLSEGIPIVCHADPKDVSTIASGIQKYSGTILVGTPTFLRMYTISKKVTSESIQSLRLVVAGAEKLRSEVRDGFETKFKMPVYEGYGTTETSPGASVNLPNIESPHKLRNRPGTVGKAFSGTEFRIVDPDSLEPLPTGEDGLILIGGPQIMKGYLKMPEKTAEVIELIDGYRWYRTGDKGHLDEDGFLTIVDRYSRFAKIGGEMISLTTVEEEILDACNDKDLEIAATCLPDQRKGEKIVLLATNNLDKNQLKKLLSDAKVNPLYHPAQVLMVDEIPKLGSGKTDFGATKKIALVNEQK
ncbi:AMP-binding protein [Candidatus Pseudothioglobus singularis]|uniref:2-acyl-glycerophospho-ethanolamine acyltransferase n=1 Tax=Candidatus Pseudothioglobus singularis PS1 TaxID=1125411 RepID=A0A0M5L0E5_9GAMM|nr:AMP-binding protein [Candidatus Pseudothioglobus singularis]ALE02186.1 2-acyl-glycerophospho-ethanolamine acyltransferase [Candidatus Pseudothioglobus singularis PS1]